jgi:hypothetical protein
MSTIYCVHASTVGKAAIRASRGTIGAALREAKFLLCSGHDFVWVDDGKGNVILPTAEVRALLAASSGENGRRPEPEEAFCVDDAVSPFDQCLDMAARSVSYARRTPDARFRSFLIDLAATWCDLARDFLGGAATGLERLAETAKTVAELDNSDPHAASSFEGLEPRMIPGLEPRIIH